MKGGNLGTLAATLIVALAMAPTAAAQKIPRAEQGSVPLVLDEFVHARATVTVRLGETAWTETVRAEKVVRLVDAAVERTRPKVDGIPAGTVLFGYRLSTGFAYCAPIDLAKVNRDVQCLRDLDGDGTFDASYITNDKGADSRYFSSFLKTLIAIPKTRYEAAENSELPPAAARVVFTGVKNGAPRFNLFIDRDRLDNTLECRVRQAGVCDVLGVRIAFAPAAEPKGAMTLAFEGAARERVFDIYDPGNHLNR